MRARAVPLALVATAVLVTVAAGYVDTLTTSAERAAAHAQYGVVTALIGALITIPAAVLLAHRPRHGVGVAMAALGLVWNVDGLAESWMAYSLDRDLPGTDFAFWFVARFGALLVAGLVVILLLYPASRLPRGRLRAPAVATLACALALPLALQVAPDSVVFSELPVAGIDTEFLAVPLPDAVATALLVVCQIATMLSVVASLVLLVLRHRGAGELERRRLRWLLWGGILCAMAVLVLVVVGNGDVATFFLALAVVTTACSITVGVVRPDLADVDALVAGTLTYAGVAVVVVGIDLAVLAVANEVLGESLDERDVTLLVLIAAVGIYGPLRAWLGSGVRRLLFGRRGDRYGVVTTFAERLERTGSVEEQLPALARAVASTFKVPYVRVEVIAPDGGVLAAEHGQQPDGTNDLDIAYRGERVGRLVLASGGLRSMLSRRDQGLLLDLVRQAAISIRASMLAEEVQHSRERLVLAREDDRRRIRRDLHDGLGPVLGGVGMLLQAADNAVPTDPERARAHVRQARSEIRDALADVRRLVHDLRPPALDDLGLEAAVRQQAERVGSELGVEVEAGDLARLPAAVEVAAYRIVAESLTNVVKHASATRCLVRLTPHPDHLEVLVADDGRGIAHDVVAGVGLLSLRERADELGGQCQVSCPETGGTEVRAWLPYDGTATHETIRRDDAGDG